MILIHLLIGAVLMFGAGELYAEYRQSKERRTVWMCIGGVLISALNLITAVGAVQ